MTRLWVVAVLTCVVVVACQRVPLTAPTGSAVTVSVDQSTLPLNGQATVRAVVIESAGTPVHNGTQVTFTANLGSFNPPNVETLNGVATTTFMAGGISGTANINAYSGGASGNTSGGVPVKIGAAAAGSLAVSATPPSVSQSGGTVTISALVLDPSNNPLPGVSVLFSSTAGSLSATTALSDATGVAKVTLTTQTTTTVRATANGTATASVDVIVSIATGVKIETTGTSFTAGSPVAITITPDAPANGSPRQIASVRVDFGDGITQTLSNVTGPVGLTHTYRNAGGYTITATATDVNGNTSISSKAIVIGFESIPTVTISLTKNPVPAADKGLAFFTVKADPATGGAPIRNVRVTLADGTVLYDGTGGGSFSYKFPPSGGNYIVRATTTDAAGATANTSTVVVVDPYTP